MSALTLKADMFSPIAFRPEADPSLSFVIRIVSSDDLELPSPPEAHPGFLRDGTNPR